MCPFTNGGGPGELALDLILYEIIGMAFAWMTLPNKSKSIDNTHRDLVVYAVTRGIQTRYCVEKNRFTLSFFFGYISGTLSLYFD